MNCSFCQNEELARLTTVDGGRVTIHRFCEHHISAFFCPESYRSQALSEKETAEADALFGDPIDDLPAEPAPLPSDPHEPETKADFNTMDVAELRTELEKSIKREDYSEAGQIRDIIKAIESKDDEESG